MKKLVYLLIGVSLLLTLVPAVASADEITVDLIAGQTDTIGTVEVWNDAGYLYVKFASTGDCLLETHVAVATNPADIPQTTKGNPIPGQFEYSDPHACVQEHTYEIPLTSAIDTELYIAAHAATGVKTSMWVSSDGNESFTAYTGPGTASYPCEPGAARSGTAVATWQHSAWGSVTSQFTYGTWIWEAYRAVDPICGTVVDFEETFDIPGEFTDGTLWVTADNGYEAYLNGTLLETDGLSGDWRNSDLTESYVTTAQAAWSSIEIATWLQLTGNVLRFETANEYFNTDDGHGSAGTVDSNPGGLIYEAEITYYADGETAWGDGTEFPGKNWGMYFTYTVQCPYEPELVNGGFETPTPTTSQGWDIYDSGTEGLGWTVEWYDGSTSYGGQTRPEPAHLEIHTSGTIVDAYVGDQYAELDTDWDGPGGGLNGEPASVKIYQVLDTCPDQEYTLTYAWRGRPGYTSALQVNFADYSTSHSGNSGEWNIVTVTATADDWTETLEFIETGPADSFGMFLDAVSVTKCDGSCP
jgi:hypothetical protein